MNYHKAYAENLNPDLSDDDNDALLKYGKSPASIALALMNEPHKRDHTMNRLHFKHYLTMHQFIIDNQIDKLKECYIEREAINCGEWNLYWRN